MGGEIGFGVRYQDGAETKEVYMRRWTNDLFWRVMSPEFFNQGKVLKELIEEAKPDNEWPDSILCEKIEPAEYGVVMVDFPTKEALSWNHYSTFGRVLITSMQTAFDKAFVNIKELSDLGVLSHAEILTFGEPGKGVEIRPKDKLKDWLDKGDVSEFRDSMITFCLSPEFMKVRDAGRTEKNWHPTYKDILAWCTAHGWKKPIQKRGWTQ